MFAKIQLLNFTRIFSMGLCSFNFVPSFATGHYTIFILFFPVADLADNERHTSSDLGYTVFCTLRFLFV